MLRSLSAITSARALLLSAALSLVAVGLYSPVALAIVILDGSTGVAILAAATGLGLWLISSFVPRVEPAANQIVLGAAVGTGVLALMVLVLGVLGVMNRVVWIAILTVFVLAGVARVIHLARRTRAVVAEDAAKAGAAAIRRSREPEALDYGRAGVSPRTSDAVPAWLWLLVMPFLVIALLSACFPPGSLLPSEAHGYDVLEYHLAVPKEYLANGRINYLPHNIYSNFPFNAEMLYLLTMILRGGAMEALYTAQLLHVGLGVLAVTAVWLAARPLGSGPAIVAAVVAATCPVVAHLAGLAYVENGLLAMTAAALACGIRVHDEHASPDGRHGGRPLHPFHDVRWSALCGGLAGLACGFKYTAVPMVLFPLGVACAWPRRTIGTSWWMRLAAFGLFAGLTFAPWLIKNTVMTGNPVFPLARNVLPERAGIWNDMLAKRWSDGHEPAPEQQSLEGRAWALLRGVVGSPQYGLLVWALPLWLGVVACMRAIGGRNAAADDDSWPSMRRAVLICGGVSIAIVVVWLTATHLVSRFAIPLVASQAVLAGVAWRYTGFSARRVAMPAVIVAGAVVNLVLFWYVRRDSALFVWPREAIGNTAIITDNGSVAKLNERLAAGKKVLLVAEARTLYLTGAPPRYEYSVIFNFSPFAEAASQRSVPQLLEWLCEQRFEYVYVDWAEMHRLRTTRYGFWPGVDQGLFARLVEAGLRVEEEFRVWTDSQVPFATLFAVPNSQRATDK